MPQLSLYIDEPTLKKVRSAARKSRVSVSKWVRSRIRTSVESSWPPGYFDLQGSITDSGFTRPEQLDTGTDMPREKM